MSKHTKPVELNEAELEAVSGGHDKWINLVSVTSPIFRPIPQGGSDSDSNSVDEIGLYASSR